MAVRRESVVLDLDDRLTPGLVRAAAATGLLNRELKNLGGGTGGASRGLNDAERDATKLNTTLGNSTREIDRFSGRLQLLTTAAVAVGPALIPIGAVGIQAIAGLSAEFGAVALSAGTAMLAFHNVGSALTAVNKAALDPTVTNLNAAQLALDGLPPAAAAFTRELANLQPQLKAAQQAAASGLFPGLSQGLDDLQMSLPQVNRILFEMGHTLGQLGAEGAQSLSGPAWADFRNFIEREAPQALEAFGHSLGNVLHGIGELVVATTPLQHGFADGLLSASAAFDQWASSVGKTQGFQDFLNFVQQSGPEVADALGAIGSAVLAIVEAAAPLSGPVLGALTAVANAIGAIGKSDLGTPIYATVTALLLLSRAQSAFGKISATSWATAFKGAEGYQAKVSALRGPLVKGGLAAAGLAVAASGVADNFGLANTATLALTGSLAGPWGAAAGAAVGLALDFAGGQHEAVVNTTQLTDTLNSQTGAITQNTRAYVAQQLQQKGVFDAAQALGVSLSDVTSAALGSADAQTRVNAQMDAYKASIAGSATAGAGFADNASKVLGAIEGTSGALHDAQGNIAQVGQAMGTAAGSFRTATSAAEAFRLEVNQVNDTLAGRASLRDYRAALDDLTASIKKNGKTLNTNKAAGRENQAALDAIAASAIKVAQTMKGTNQTHFLTQARKDFIDSAEKLGLDQAQAKALADKLGLLNRVHSAPTIAMKGIPESLSQLRQVYAALAALRNKTVTVTTKHVTGGSVKMGNADGGTIGGQRHPYGDKVLSWLAPGEEVISNRHGQADRFRADRAAGRIPGYAGGGTVGSASASGNPDSETHRLARAIAELTKSIDADKKSRDAWGQKSQALAQQVAGSFQSDIFAASGVWSAGSSPNGILRSDIRSSTAFEKALRRAHHKGLNGGAFEALAASGNLQAAQFEAGQSRSDLRTTDRLFNRRQQVSRATGRYAADVRYGARLASIEKVLHAEHAELIKLRREAARHAHQASKDSKQNSTDTTKGINGTGARAVRARRR